LGTLAKDTADLVEDHLQTCPVCEATVDDLESVSDTVIEELRRPAPVDPYERESGCDRMVSLIEQIGQDPSFTRREGAATGRDDRQSQRQIRDYRLLAKLGQGGMGTVHKALHIKLDKVVALKVLPGERMKDAAAVARFEREMKAVGKLDHPNIVRASDAGEEEGTHFLVMEYVKGLDLSTLVKRHGPLPIATACELIRQAAVGLHHAHLHGLVHRDIKPSNLMLTPTGVVKVLDMGLALLGGLRDEATRDLTSTGQMMGTLDYMAPEQGNDSHEVDIRADVYSLGATLYRLLTGEVVYPDAQYPGPMSKLMALATRPAPPVQERRPEVADELAAVVHRMLAKAPDERFATPADVAHALEPFASDADPAGLLSQVTGEPVPEDELSASSVATAPDVSSSEIGTVPSESSIREGEAPAEPSARPAISAEAVTNPKLPHWIPAAAVALGLAGILTALGIILSVQTPEGTLLVELDEKYRDEVEVLVSRGGKKVTISREHGWEVELEEGEYRITLIGGQDTLQLDNEKVTVRRNDRAVVTVTKRR
jgi:serine/threonine protein kinase